MVGLVLDYTNAHCPKCKSWDYLRWAHKAGNTPIDYDLYCLNCGARFTIKEFLEAKKETNGNVQS